MKYPSQIGAIITSGLVYSLQIPGLIYKLKITSHYYPTRARRDVGSALAWPMAHWAVGLEEH